MIDRIRQLARFAGLVVRHPGIPKWLRVGLIVCLAIPGPVDELVAFIVIGALLLTRRFVITECWEASK